MRIRVHRSQPRRRLEAGLGQERLADSAGMHRTHVGLLERGKLMPSLAVVHKLATALKVSMAALLAEVETEGAVPEAAPVPRGRPRKPKAVGVEPPAAPEKARSKRPLPRAPKR